MYLITLHEAGHSVDVRSTDDLKHALFITETLKAIISSDVQITIVYIDERGSETIHTTYGTI